MLTYHNNVSEHKRKEMNALDRGSQGRLLGGMRHESCRGS